MSKTHDKRPFVSPYLERPRRTLFEAQRDIRRSRKQREHERARLTEINADGSRDFSEPRLAIVGGRRHG